MIASITTRRAGCLLDNATCPRHWNDTVVGLHVPSTSLVSPCTRSHRLPSCPTLGGKAGLRFDRSEEHPARSRACRLHHTVLAGKHAHQASVRYSDQVCARCNARLDLSGSGPPPREQWRAQTRQRAGFQRVSRYVSLHSADGTDKDTDSCERCRRQKIKCSGKEPCDACQKRQLLCNFDEQNQKILVTRESVQNLVMHMIYLTSHYLPIAIVQTSSSTSKRCSSGL